MRLTVAAPAFALGLCHLITPTNAQSSTKSSAQSSDAISHVPTITSTFSTTFASNSSTSFTDNGNVIVGTFVSSSSSSSSNGTATSSSAQPTNTRPCNGFPELCERKFGNITFVGAHNSPFDLANNVGSNQQYGAIAQLNDGVRMLQGQVHDVNGTLHLCHTSCTLLDAGTLEDYLANVTAWLSATENALDVVAILLVNAEYLEVGNFTAPMVDSGLEQFAYVPPKVPMSVEDWPSLAEIILNGGKRALVFMDYKANQTQVPYIMDEFTQMWETPSDPVDTTFPCTVQRPEGINNTQAKDMLYLANHNLNGNVSLFGSTILIPATSALNQTNGLGGAGSLGLAANSCRADWGRTPNFLLVDYYNYGTYPGSVFEVAARANGLTYTGSCCGLYQVISAATIMQPMSSGALILVALVVVALL